MSEEIFRKKNLDKIKSPESLDDYICVLNPGVWLLLISVILLLVGASIWGILGHIDSSVPTTVHIENGQAVCTIPEDEIASVNVGLIVKFENREAVIEAVGENADKGYICTLSDGLDLSDGFYEGKVIVESYKPLSFILN